MKFRKETTAWCSLFVFSLLACYKLAGSKRKGKAGGFLNNSISSFLTAFFAALALAGFYLMVRLCKTGSPRTSFRDILSAWLFSGGSVAGWGFFRMFLKKQAFRYSSLWGAVVAAIVLFILWKFFGSAPGKEEADNYDKTEEE